MKELSERVQREFDKMKEMYIIPYTMEFQVKTLLKLQEEYDSIEVGSNTTRTRETLLHMIQELQRSIRLEPKPTNTTKNYKVLIVCEKCNLNELADLFEKLIDFDNIKVRRKSSDKYIIVFYNGFEIVLAIKDKDIIKEIQCNEFIDLTNDTDFRDNILIHLLKK